MAPDRQSSVEHPYKLLTGCLTLRPDNLGVVFSVNALVDDHHVGGDSYSPTICEVLPCYISHPFGCGSKLSHQGTADFGPCCHLPGFHFGYLFLTHVDMGSMVTAPLSLARRSSAVASRSEGPSDLKSANGNITHRAKRARTQKHMPSSHPNPPHPNPPQPTPTPTIPTHSIHPTTHPLRAHSLTHSFTCRAVQSLHQSACLILAHCLHSQKLMAYVMDMCHFWTHMVVMFMLQRAMKVAANLEASYLRQMEREEHVCATQMRGFVAEKSTVQKVKPSAGFGGLRCSKVSQFGSRSP